MTHRCHSTRQPMTTHRYQSLPQTVLAVVRIFGPVKRSGVLQELRRLRWQLAFDYVVESVPDCLELLAAQGQISWSPEGWQAQAGRLLEVSA